MRGNISRVLFHVICITLACPGVSASPQPDRHQAKHHSVHLTWQPGNAGTVVVGYNIYRSSAGQEHFRKLNASPVPKPVYDDKTVRSGMTYLYVVKSVDAKGKESGPSNEIRMSVP
jgi:fibronectin type 3 domain-containing protein